MGIVIRKLYKSKEQKKKDLCYLNVRKYYTNTLIIINCCLTKLKMYIVKSIVTKFGFMVACCAVIATSSKFDRRSEDEFECPQNWGYYEDPENCIKYYNCEFGEAHSVTCRSEMGVQLLYDHHHNYCDWPERVNCGSRPICDENNENCHDQEGTTPRHETTTKQDELTTTQHDEVTTTKHDEVTTEESDGFECPDPWGYFGDPENCIKYYICQEGIPTRMTCQTESGIQLHYNEDNVWCDWPDRVDCGSRPICDVNDENCE